MRFKIQDSSPTEVSILVEGRVALYFRNIEGRVVKVAALSHDRKSAVVPRKDFLDARALAIETMEDLRIAVEEERGMSNEEIAKRVVKMARDSEPKTSISTALDTYLAAAKTWCSPARRSRILQKIGEIGGNASKRRAAAKRRKAEKEARAARQGKLL